jgi:hypothetical protein
VLLPRASSGWLLAFAVVTAFFSATPGLAADHVVPLPRAHAHNDYHHSRPLVDALAHGFCGVEADIFLRDGKLLVGHSEQELRPDRTLEALYLVPLKRLAKANGGRIYPGGPTLTLLIDIKSDGLQTYQALRGVLAQYRSILSSVSDGVLTRRAVTVIISGNRPRDAIAADSPRYAAVDGRLTDLDATLPAHLLPLISDHWGRHFRWQGDAEPMPAEQRARLRAIVTQAHAAGRRVRFWATPDRPAMWAELDDAGVDLINTDDLPGLERFLLDRR